MVWLWHTCAYVYIINLIFLVKKIHTHCINKLIPGIQSLQGRHEGFIIHPGFEIHVGTSHHMHGSRLFFRGLGVTWSNVPARYIQCCPYKRNKADTTLHYFYYKNLFICRYLILVFWFLKCTRFLKLVNVIICLNSGFLLAEWAHASTLEISPDQLQW